MKEELNLGYIFQNLVRFIDRNKKIIFVFVFVNILFTTTYYLLLRPKQYQSVALCTSHISKFEQLREFQRVAVDLINKLQIFIDAKDYKGLSDVLSIDYDVATSISSIQATQLYQLDLNEEYRNVNKFEIRLIVLSNAYYSEIEEGILHYFNNNDYLSKISSAYMEDRLSVYNDIVQEIKALRKERLITKSSRDLIKTEVNSSDKAINEIIDLAQKRESTLRDIKTSNVFTFVQGFNRLNISQNYIWDWIMISSVISFLLALFIALIREKL